MDCPQKAKHLIFDQIVERGLIESTAAILDTDGPRLLRELELFIEAIPPQLAIMIDDTNQDLLDFAEALDVGSQIYKIRKFVVNGRTEIYSPDRNLPAVEFDADSTRTEGSKSFEAIEQLGGGEVLNSRLRCYKLADGRIVKVHYSQFYESHDAFWFGISPGPYAKAKSLGCTEFVFVLGDIGFVVVPIPVVDAYIAHAYTTTAPDGTVRHYHVHITPPPTIVFKGYATGPDVPLAAYFQAFD